MHIKSITLKGYKRVSLNQISSIHIDFTSKFQIILGTNGSGKSSIVKELSPLPANPKQFYKGGCKTIVIEYNGNVYKLISDFSGKAFHYFHKNDGPNLNEAGIISGQRRLVEQEFGYTDELHELATGLQNFTDMSPGKRRDIITRLSDSDMTYAFDVYKSMASSLRDLQGAYKHTKQRITTETDKLRNRDDSELQEWVNKLQEELTTLMENVDKNLPNQSIVEERLSGKLRRAEQLATTILKDPIYITNPEYKSSQDIWDQVNSAKATSNDVQSKLTHYSNEHEKLNQLVGNLEDTGEADIGKLEEKSNSYQKRIDTLSTKIKAFSFDGDTSDINKRSQQLKELLVEVLSELPDNADGFYTKDNRDAIEKRITEYRSKYDGLQSKLNQQRAKLDRLSDVDHTECPKCNHKWRVGVCEKELEELRSQVVQLEKDAENASQELEKTYTDRESIQHYINIYKRLKDIQYNYPQASNLFDYLTEDNRLYYQPSQYIPKIDDWMYELDAYTEMYQLEQEKKVLDSTIEQAKMLDSGNQKHIKEHLTDLDKEITNLTDSLRQSKEEYSALEEYAERVVNRDNEGENLNSLLQEINGDVDLLMKSIRNDKINSLIQEHQTNLAIQTQHLRERQTIEDVLKDLNKNLEDLETDLEVLKNLAKAMSPHDGIIADQIGVFISCLTEQMNEVISSIYTYPMEILPCKLDSQELDYKFPLMVKGEVNSDDIKESSSGQSEIINFAFKIVALMYLGFTGFPLYLDEIGNEQDETHLANVMSYIRSIIDAGHHSQMFMISHFALGHGSFNQAEVLVLDPSNVTVPSKYNLHANIT